MGSLSSCCKRRHDPEPEANKVLLSRSPRPLASDRFYLLADPVIIDRRPYRGEFEVPNFG